MNRLRAFSLIVAATAVIHSVVPDAAAAPIVYTVDCDVMGFDPLVFDPFGGDPLGLTGASLTLVYAIDTAVLAPDFDGAALQADQATEWPDSNTTAWLRIMGSTGADGTYEGTITGGSRFGFWDNGNGFFGSLNGMDVVQFPDALFAVMGETFETAGLIVAQDDSFNTPSGPIHAYSFDSSDVTQTQDVSLYYRGGVAVDSVGATANTVASAVPEPSTGLLVTACVLGLAASRRKRSD